MTGFLSCCGFFLAAIHFVSCSAHSPNRSLACEADGPTVKIKNGGALEGLHLPSFNEHVFLGVPFAQPPVGNLRLRHAASLNESWSGTRMATVRSPSCPGYAGFDVGLTLAEDCLTVDIVRPSGIDGREGLPVYVWIYGGGKTYFGFTAGGSADPRYNSSYLVNVFIVIGKPIIAVTLNYREMQAADASNIGLFDQRLALKWIRENIRAYGGDPDKVVIAGESTGAFSVGYHLVGCGGNHENIFRGVILESGAALDQTPIYDNVTDTVGCSSQKDSLQCLREVSYEALFNAFAPFVVTPILDGKFLSQLPSESFKEGKVASVAILAGTNTDEGTATFFGPRGILNTDADVHEFLAAMGNGLDNKTVSKLVDLYPDDPELNRPFITGPERYAANGEQYKRGAAISPWNIQEILVAVDAPVFSTHYAEICFVFNIAPDASRNNTNWIGPYPEYHELSNLMSRMFISFVHDLSPNYHGVRGIPQWPDYGCGKKKLVFKVKTSYVEKDDWRVPQLAYWNSIWGKFKT
ncbi:Alpha/Beta hydrolase protein [Trichoderma barbatum]